MRDVVQFDISTLRHAEEVNELCRLLRFVRIVNVSFEYRVNEF